jgi:hypothetical protein
MKTSIIVSALLSFGILGLAAGFLAGKFTEDARATSGTVTASDLARLEERLAGLESKLETLSSLGSELEALKREGRRGQDLAEPQAVTATPVETAAAVPPRAEGEPSRLEAWLEDQGMKGDFEDLVSRVYLQARNSRMAREREEAEERAREMEALSQGPYGKHNYQVNSLSKKLGLDARQEQYLYNLLLKYEERRNQELSQIAPPEGENSPDRFKEHVQQTVRVHQELNQQFEQEFLAGLDPKQQEAYQDLPEHERAMGGDNVKMAYFEGGAGVLGMKTGVRFAVPVPAVKPMAPPAPAPPRGK